MSTPYARAPHVESPSKGTGQAAPNAALLIDFDNVTMGMRSDLSDELKNLLNSDIIKGKVAVQRAYADWRRYPQYIVPLSEASIDLIFAPAYGSNKKNATDIRMAIDALELIFVRPEIGTFILLTGDSDFSSLVLKLKEYGKYVIGVGIQESSSDILVQNCDEYYSYTALAGLRKTTDSDTEPVDPWLLVEKALERMENRKDVMRSDRLKQVMMEIDAGFDEGEYGFSKFSRFLTEASSKNLVELKKLDNGQYEVHPTGSAQRSGGRSGGDGGRSGGGGGGRSSSRSSGGGSDRSSGGGSGRSSGGGSGGGRPSSTRSRGRSTRSRGRGSSGESRSAPEPSREPKKEEKKEERREEKPTAGGDPLQDAYDLLQRAVRVLTRERDVPAVRDSDVKRRMLSFEGGFDEAELGFSKFSRFLQQADEHDVIDLRTRESGNYEVSLVGEGRGAEEPQAADDAGSEAADDTGSEAADDAGSGAADDASGPEAPGRPGPTTSRDEAAAEPEDTAPKKEEEEESVPEPTGRVLGPRGGERQAGRGRKKKGPPPILEGQVVGSSQSGGTSGDGDRTSASGESGASSDDGERGASDAADRKERSPAAAPPLADREVVDPDDLGLPTDRAAIVRYLANSYKGVGEKTAEAVVDAVGEDVFRVLQESPDRVRQAIPSNRADQLMDAWETDLRRRRERLEEAGVDLEPADSSGNGGRGASGGGESGGDESGGSRDASGGGSRSEPRASGDGEAEEADEDEQEPAPTRLGRRRTTRR